MSGSSTAAGTAIESHPPAPSRYVAFLRAINVRGRTVKMADLRAIVGEIGFSNVETFIASGNVIFESTIDDGRLLETCIEQGLAASLGYEVSTFVRSTSELAAIPRHIPFPSSSEVSEGAALHVGFLHAVPSVDRVNALMACRSDIDDFYTGGREVYWRCLRKVSESTFSGVRLEKALGVPSTMRNWNTVQRLASRYCLPHPSQ